MNYKWLFIVIALLIIGIQFSLLKIILTFGLTSEDWLLLFDYKTIGASDNFFDKLFSAFHATGIYSTTYIMYIGILESLFKDNYSSYQITNILFKTLAAVSLFPLILVIFKSRLLAFLTTILFAISYSSSGALQFVVKGSDYLAIFFMNICLISYYYSFKTKKKLLTILTAILLFLCFIFSPIRIYPFLGLVILIEIFIWIKSKKSPGIIFSLGRLFLLFMPFLIILRSGPGPVNSYLNHPITMFNFIADGNYQLLLSPFAGLGYTFLPNDYWYIFGNLNLNNFRDYLSFLLHGPVIIYSMAATILGFLITKATKTRFIFILGIILTNIIFEIICYFLINNLRGETGPNVKGFYAVSTYAIFLGFFVISVAFAGLILWFKNKSNILLLSLFAGPLFSSVFLWGTWLIIGESLTFKEGIHWYLIIPPIGTSLFLASLMVLAFKKIKLIANSNLRKILITCLFLMILPIYLISSKEINKTFTNLLDIGYGASDTEGMKNKVLSHMKNPYDGKPALFYFEISKDSDPIRLFYVVTVISGFEQKMHLTDGQVIDGCIGLISDEDTFKQSVIVKDGVKGFNASSLCVKNSFQAGRMEVFYSPENLYALRLGENSVTDIKEETLKKLGFQL